MSARQRLTLAILLVMATLLVGAAGYMWIEHDLGISFLDALYQTVITVSTVGFSEVWTMSDAGRIWTIGVIAFGIAAVSYAFTSLITMVISEEFRSLRGQMKMQKKIELLTNHVVLCGAGRMGSLTAKELASRNVPVVVIDNRSDAEEELKAAEIHLIRGDATDEEVLLQAGLLRARALVIALPSDADNVFVSLTARAINPDLMIIARAEQPSTETKLIRAGATRVVCPHTTGAIKVANVLTRPSVVDFMDLASKGVDLEIDEYVVADASPLVSATLREAHVRSRTGAIVIAIKRADGESIVNPEPDAVMAAGDTLILAGPVGVSGRLAALSNE